MYKVFYDYYGNCYEYAVPEGSKLEKCLMRFIHQNLIMKEG